MGKSFIFQNIGKETSPYSIQLHNDEGGYWEDANPFRNVVRYNTGAAGHWPGEPMHFRIYPVADPDYLELYYAGGNEGTFSWESNKDPESVINDGSTLYCPGGGYLPGYSEFWISAPESSSTVQTLELEVFLGGESGEMINLGTLYLTHDQNLSKKWTCTQCGYVYEGISAPISCPVCRGTDFITT